MLLQSENLTGSPSIVTAIVESAEFAPIIKHARLNCKFLDETAFRNRGERGELK